MFGNQITSGTLLLVGTYGRVLAFDLSNENIDALKAIQVIKPDDDEVYPQITEHTVRSVLFGYSENADCPDLAMCQEGSVVYVFTKLTPVLYTTDFEISFWFTANQPANIIASTKIPIPSESRSLLKAYLKLGMWEDKGGRIPFEVENDVRKQKAALGL